MDGEWFCRDFDDDGGAEKQAVEHFLAIRGHLQPQVLYEFSGDPFAKDRRLDEHPFETLAVPKRRSG
jgi:hypothetical protein